MLVLRAATLLALAARCSLAEGELLVAAASDLIGSPSRGGSWQLKVRKFPGEPSPPLTAAGMAGYAGLLADNYLNIAFPAGTNPNRYFIVTNLRGVQTVIGDFTVPKTRTA